MDERLTALEKRVAELEAELKRYKGLEWDRLYIREMQEYARINDGGEVRRIKGYHELGDAVIEPPMSAPSKAFKADYYRRIAELETARDKGVDTTA
jgi:hypothetical protein